MRFMTLILFCAALLFSAEVTWRHDYRAAQKEAMAEQKPMLVFLSREWCGGCRVMKEKVFTDKTVSDYMAEHFVTVAFDTEREPVPEALAMAVTPVFHFLDPQGKPVRELLVGGKMPPKFLKLLEEADARFRSGTY